jgi:hypothetical protein
MLDPPSDTTSNLVGYLKSKGQVTRVYKDVENSEPNPVLLVGI